MNFRILTLSLLLSSLMQGMVPGNNYPKESVAMTDNMFLLAEIVVRDYEVIEPAGNENNNNSGPQETSLTQNQVNN